MRFEWAHTSDGFSLIGPEELEELAPAGNEAQEWGLSFTTGSNGCMIYGSLEDLHSLAVGIGLRIEAVQRDNELIIGTHGHDPVNHPSHYSQGWSNGAEVIDIVEHLNFCRGNAVKYIARAGKKDQAKEIEDLEKAQWYLNREIERLKKEVQERDDKP
jgi:hypothetical protein